MARRKDTKQIILDTAMQLFWQSSYESVGTDLICKAANVRKGSLYHFFPSKDVLAFEVVNERWRLFESQVLKLAFDKNIPPLKRFERFADIVTSMVIKMKEKNGDVYGCPFANFACELSTQKTEIRQRITQIFDKYIQYFEQSMQDAVAAGELPARFNCAQNAKLLFTSVQGSVLLAKSTNDPSFLPEHFQQIFVLLQLSKENELAVA